METRKKPNKILDTKNEDYHRRMARFILANQSCTTMNDVSYRRFINEYFFKGKQWIMEEDLDAFLLDDNNGVRNRVKFVKNIVKPYATYLIGQTIRTDYSFDVTSISTLATKRKNKELSLIKAAARVHDNMSSEEGKAVVKGLFPQVRENEEETVKSFENLYVDRKAFNMRRFVEFVSTVENDFEDIKNSIASSLVFSGMAIVKEEERNGRQYFSTIDVDNFNFDETATKPDLSDASFMYDYEVVSKVDVYEKYDVSQNNRLKIESYSSASFNSGGESSPRHAFGRQHIFGRENSDKVVIYRVRWRDIEEEEFVAALDENGNPILLKKKVNEEQFKYQLIDEADLESYTQKWIKRFIKKKSNTVKIQSDSIRFIEFIPGMYSSSGSDSDDIVLDFGIDSYSMSDSFSRRDVDFPYKIATYFYIGGDILSPIEELISPQRFINRTMSVMESQVANSGGANVFIDKDSVDSDISDISSDMNKGKPISLFAGRNLNNSVIPYDNTVKAGTFDLVNVIKAIDSMAKDMVGGEAISGNGGAYRVSVGALRQNLNQGTIIQEPFFYSIYKCIEKCYKSILNRGRKIYAENSSKIAMIIDGDVMEFILDEDYLIEDFAFKVDKANDSETSKNEANNTMLQLLQIQLLDQQTFSKYYGNVQMGDIPYIIRESARLKAEAARSQEQAAKEQNAQEQVQQITDAQAAGNDQLIQEKQQMQTDLANKLIDHKMQSANTALQNAKQ